MGMLEEDFWGQRISSIVRLPESPPALRLPLKNRIPTREFLRLSALVGFIFELVDINDKYVIIFIVGYQKAILAMLTDSS